MKRNHFQMKIKMKTENEKKWFPEMIMTEEESRVNSLRSNLRGKARLSGPPIKQTKILEKKKQEQKVRLRGAVRVSFTAKNTHQKK